MLLVRAKDFLTNDEIKIAKKMFKQAEESQSNFAGPFCEEVITPNMKRIDKALGQKNDPMYLAYVVEYTLMKGEL